MRRRCSSLCAAILGLGVSIGAHGSVLDTPGDNLEVSLVTYGPGEIYWERFGHDAIRLRDRNSGEAVDFNYGVFDFEESGFLLNFLHGDMHYMLDIEHSGPAQQDYIDAGRSVVEQRLALSAEQAVRLRSFLIWNLLPENVTYHYDYLTNNCATRVRDAFDLILGGTLKKSLVERPGQMTYRQQIDRLMSAQPWMMLPMDFGLGPSADAPLSEWQESFLPMVLAHGMQNVQIPDGHGGVQPLVVNEDRIAPNKLEPPRTTPPNLAVPLGIVGFILAAVLLASRSRFPRLYTSLVTIYLALAGFAGTMLLALWTLTTHHAAWGNANLLVFNPAAFILIGAVWWKRNTANRRHELLTRVLVSLQLAATSVAVLLHLLPGLVQQNLPWLLFGIPVWLAIAAGIFSKQDLHAATPHTRRLHARRNQ